MGKQFDESKHPRDETGKFIDGVGTKAEQEKLKELGISIKDGQTATALTNEEKRLQELTGEKVEHELTDKEKKKEEEKWREEQKAKIQKFKPVSKKLKDKTIVIEFDENSAGKNINSEKFNSDRAGWKWKQRNIHRWREMLANAKHTGSSPEKGNKFDKNGNIKAAHFGVKEWHYYQGVTRDETGKRYKYKFHIRDKGKKQYVYELEIHLLKTKKNKKEPRK